MKARIVDENGAEIAAAAPTVAASQLEALKREGRFFWLDIRDLDDASAAVLSEALGFHQLALEDALTRGQRPKVEDYDGFVFLVLYGADADGAPAEVHAFYTRGCVVTVAAAGALDASEVAHRLQLPTDGAPPAIKVLYHVIDTLVDSLFPVLADLDDRIDSLEDQIVQRPTDQQLAELFDMKRHLVVLRKAVTPQRDAFARLLGAGSIFPDMSADSERYFRDVYDHLIRISDLVDSYRDLVSGAMDVYLSTVSNRLNQVMKQLTIIATIFLPLSFLTGFFGQNFNWLISHVETGLAAFLIFGLGLEALAVVALVALFKRRQWL